MLSIVLALLFSVSLSNLYGQNEISNSTLLEQAQSFSDKKEYVKAITSLQQAIYQNPNFNLAKLELANVYYKTGQYPLALASINMVPITNASSIDLYVLHAKINLANQNYAVADTIINALLVNYSNSGVGDKLRALSFMLQGKMRSAEIILLELKNIFVDDRQILIMLTILYSLKKEDSLRRQETLETLARVAPYDRTMNQLLANYNNEINSLDLAASNYKLLLIQNENVAYNLEQLAFIALKEGKYDEAQQLFTRIFNYQPNEQTILGLFYTYLANDQVDFGLDVLEQTQNQFKTEDDFNWFYGYFLNKFTNMDNPKRLVTANMHLDLSESYVNQGNLKLAIKESKVARRLAPYDNNIMQRYADIYAQSGYTDFSLYIWDELEKNGVQATEKVKRRRWRLNENKRKNTPWLDLQLPVVLAPDFPINVSFYVKKNDRIVLEAIHPELLIDFSSDILDSYNYINVSNNYNITLESGAVANIETAIVKAQADNSDLLVWLEPEYLSEYITYNVFLINVGTQGFYKQFVMNAYYDERIDVSKKIDTVLSTLIPDLVQVVDVVEDGIVIQQGKRQEIVSTDQFYASQITASMSRKEQINTLLSELDQLKQISQNNQVSLNAPNQPAMMSYTVKDRSEEYTLLNASADSTLVKGSWLIKKPARVSLQTSSLQFDIFRSPFFLSTLLSLF